MKTHRLDSLPASYASALEDLLASLDESLAVVGPDLRIIAFNEAACNSFRELHGRELAVGLPALDLLRPADVESFRQIFQDVLHGHKRVVEHSHRLEGGGLRVYRNHLRPFVQGGSVAGIIVHARDISDQYRSEQALRESNARFGRAAEASFDMIWEHDLRTHRLSLSEQFFRQLGYPEPEMDARYFRVAVIHPDDAAAVRDKVTAFLASGRTHLYYPPHRLRKISGDYIFVEAHAIVSRDEHGVPYLLTGVTRDITAQHLLAEELRESHRRFELAARASVDLIFEADMTTGALSHNDVLHTVYGYAPGELSIAERSTELIHPDDFPTYTRAIEEALAAGHSHVHVPVLRLRKKNGDIVYTEIKALLICDEQGRLLKRIGSARDITRQHLNELELHSLNQQLERQATALQESMERHTLVSRATSDVVWDWNLLTNENWFNDNFELLFGNRSTSSPDISAWEDRLHPDDRERILDSVDAAIHSGEPYWEGEYRFRKADGSWAHILDRGHTLYNEQGEPVRMIGSMQDISHLRALQEEILQKQLRYQRHITEAALRSQEQERATLGRELHDNINQILASCKLLTEMALREENLRDLLLERTHNQLVTVINEIRSLSHSLVPPALGDIGLEGALRELTGCKSVSGDTLVHLSVSGCTQRLDDEIALMLYRVAQEALHNIQKYAKATEIHINLTRTAHNVQLRIADNGIGFDPATRKEGIGLRNIRTRIQLHQGDLQLDAAPGKGCALTIRIPLAATS
ncbi:PAS domain-containing protein [Flaviaesturariibacter terrae]